MTTDHKQDPPRLTRAVRQMILTRPELLTSDPEVMAELGRHLAHEGDIVDIRAKALDNMSAEIARLNAKNDQILASAYETAAATDQVHRAILRLAEMTDRAGFISMIEDQLPGILRIPHAKIENRFVRQLTLNGYTAELPLDDGNVLVLTGNSSAEYAPSVGKDILRFFHRMLQILWSQCRT